jgi:type III secretory pathway component EscS
MNYNLIYLNMFIYIIISTWSLVGLWRSTIKYQIKKGAKTIPFFVKLLILLSTVFYLYYVLSGSYIADSTKRIDVAKEFFEKGLK